MANRLIRVYLVSCFRGQTGVHTRPLHQGPWKASYAPDQDCHVNVNLRKLLSAHKSHVRETSLFTSAMLEFRSFACICLCSSSIWNLLPSAAHSFWYTLSLSFSHLRSCIYVSGSLALGALVNVCVERNAFEITKYDTIARRWIVSKWTVHD